MNRTLPVEWLEDLVVHLRAHDAGQFLDLLGRNVGEALAVGTAHSCRETAAILSAFSIGVEREAGGASLCVPLTEFLMMLRSAYEAAIGEKERREVRRAKRMADDVLVSLLEHSPQTQTQLSESVLRERRSSSGDRSLLHRVVSKLRRDGLLEEDEQAETKKRDGRKKPLRLTTAGKKIAKKLQRPGVMASPEREAPLYPAPARIATDAELMPARLPAAAAQTPLAARRLSDQYLFARESAEAALGFVTLLDETRKADFVNQLFSIDDASRWKSDTRLRGAKHRAQDLLNTPVTKCVAGLFIFALENRFFK